MPLAAMGEIIGPARAAGRGVGAFNVIGIEHAEVARLLTLIGAGDIVQAGGAGEPLPSVE
jgi:fructose-bisphosphate aldolase class II